MLDERVGKGDGQNSARDRPNGYGRKDPHVSMEIVPEADHQRAERAGPHPVQHAMVNADDDLADDADDGSYEHSQEHI